MAVGPTKKNTTKLGGETFLPSPTLAQATAATNQAVIPTTPLSAAGLGASPDASKMTGTPNQLKGIARPPTGSMAQTQGMRLELPETKALEWQDKIKQDPRKLTELEQEVKAQAEALNPQLGSFASLVPVMALRASMGGLLPGQVVTDSAAVNTWVTAQNQARPSDQQIRQEDFSANLMGIVTNPGNVSLMTQFREKYGIDNPETLANLITSTAGAEAAKAITDPDSLTMDKVLAGKTPEQIQLELGVSEEDLEKAFGEDWRSKTWGQMKEALASVNSRATSTRELMNVANNPNVGAAQRSEARKALRELGVLGVRPAEEKINDIIAQVEDGDTLTIDGTQMELEEVLKDDYLSAKITEAVDDPEKRRQLREWAPELADWLDKNEEAVRDATSKMDTTLKTVKEIQAYNRDLKVTKLADGTSVELTDDLMRAFYPDWGKTSDTRIAIDDPIYQTIQTLSGPEKGTLVDTMNTLSKTVSPEMLRDVLRSAKLSGDPANYLRGNGFMDGARAGTIISKAQTIANFDKDFTANPDYYMGQLFSGSGLTTKNSMTEVMKTISGDKYLVEALEKANIYELDVNGDGKFNRLDVADPQKLAAHLKSYLATGGVVSGPSIDVLKNQISTAITRARDIAEEIKKEEEVVKTLPKQVSDHGKILQNSARVNVNDKVLLDEVKGGGLTLSSINPPSVDVLSNKSIMANIDSLVSLARTQLRDSIPRLKYRSADSDRLIETQISQYRDKLISAFSAEANRVAREYWREWKAAGDRVKASAWGSTSQPGSGSTTQSTSSGVPTVLRGFHPSMGGGAEL